MTKEQHLGIEECCERCGCVVDLQSDDWQPDGDGFPICKHCLTRFDRAASERGWANYQARMLTYSHLR